MWLHSLKVAQLLRSAACLHTNQSRSYLNHLVLRKGTCKIEVTHPERGRLLESRRCKLDVLELRRLKSDVSEYGPFAGYPEGSDMTSCSF